MIARANGRRKPERGRRSLSTVTPGMTLARYALKTLLGTTAYRMAVADAQRELRYAMISENLRSVNDALDAVEELLNEVPAEPRWLLAQCLHLRAAAVEMIEAGSI